VVVIHYEEALYQVYAPLPYLYETQTFTPFFKIHSIVQGTVVAPVLDFHPVNLSSSPTVTHTSCWWRQEGPAKIALMHRSLMTKPS